MRIVYVDIDCARPDHLGAYGYARPTSPAIDAIAARGTTFTAAHVSDAPCLPSRAALETGRFGIANGVTCHDGPASQLRYAGCGHYNDDDAYPMWMRVLQNAGWTTACFSGFAQRHMGWWFNAGFTDNFGNKLNGGAEQAGDVNVEVLPWLEANGAEDDWFLHVTYYDAHTPYRADERYVRQISAYPAPEFPDAQDIARDAESYYGPRTPRDWWHDGTDWANPSNPLTRTMPHTGPQDWESYLGFLNGYDAGIRHIDEKVGEITAMLERLGIREETAIIVSADHGESIGELGMYFEHGNAMEGTTRVPLIVDWPGLPGGVSSDALVYQLDLPPTVLALLGVDVPEGWHGRSFEPALRGEDFEGRDHLVLSCGIYSFQRAVRTKTHRLVRTIHPGVYPYEPLYLFDMESDPHQTRNIATARPDLVAQLDHLLLEWIFEHTTGPAAQPDPFQVQLAAGVTPDLYCPLEKMEARLADTGRRAELEELRRRRQVRRPLSLTGQMVRQ